MCLKRSVGILHALRRSVYDFLFIAGINIVALFGPSPTDQCRIFCKVPTQGLV